MISRAPAKASIEPPGLPAMRLEAVRLLLALEVLGDEDMVNAQRGSLLDSTAPNPSVEALLHAFLPHKFIDHTHAAAVLALTDQPDGEDLCANVYGERAAMVPYIMPGFALAKRAREVAAANPGVEGLILLKHGIVSFGETARESYERMIELVSLAEERLARDRRAPFQAVALPAKLAAPAAGLEPGGVAPPLDRARQVEDHRHPVVRVRGIELFLQHLAGHRPVGGEGLEPAHQQQVQPLGRRQVGEALGRRG